MPTVGGVDRESVSSTAITGAQSLQTTPPAPQTRDRLETSPTSTQNAEKETNCFMRFVTWIYDGLVYIWHCICCMSQPSQTPAQKNKSSIEDQTPQTQVATTAQRSNTQTLMPEAPTPTMQTEAPTVKAPLKEQTTDAIVVVDVEQMKRVFAKEWAKVTPDSSVEDHETYAKLEPPPRDERFFRDHLEAHGYQTLSWHARDFEKLDPAIKAQLFCDLVRTTPKDRRTVPLYLDAVKKYALRLSGAKFVEICLSYDSMDAFINSVIKTNL